MSDPISNAPEEVRKAHINEVMALFREPGQVSYTKNGLTKIDALYEIAAHHEPNNPVAWIRDFERANPLDLEVGGEKTRVGAVLVMAQIYHKEKQKADQALRRQGPGAIRRDFSV